MKWCYSLNGDEYEGLYDSKEEAVQAGHEASCNEDLNVFWVAKAEKTFVPGVDVESLIERIRDAAEDDGGEWAQDYLSEITREQEAELEEKMNEVLHEWLDKYKHEVNFYSVVGEEEMEAEPQE